MSTQKPSASKKLCHYVVLECHRKSTTDEIKQAYKKMALKWHPDRNVGNNQDEAAEYFKLVQEAYEVLTDAQVSILPGHAYDSYIHKHTI
jgi:curved DNA-binding protein CbpA